jgi:aspartyl-tRNA(Asn)/glutamyl-tRNA(Gln) amidotransferase subunit C
MISKEEVLKIAKLARLELTPQETEKMQQDLSSILDYFDILKKAPKVNLNDQKRMQSDNATRSDETANRPASIANNLIEVAPDKKDGYIKVKAVL